MDTKEIELYKEEILELTELLNEEWLDLKELIKESNLNIHNLLLISYCEDENDREFGVFFTKERKVIRFIVQDKKLQLEDITNNKEIEIEFPQIKVARDFF
ncbi:hypothetical protein [Flavobacterium ginsenosidimutans]|uniref:hypothetical protein n=1 Tax=Flavobacterium ginsenosidimutans TaxID=687844 RepID=UPI000DAB700B|nr:hypothetical protein [Flavobacterium ginsenosidimutans]KAF2337741.1 hypothetical protein DM444_02210 [Flavobacterium ginsenosidimutans]